MAKDAHPRAFPLRRRARTRLAWVPTGLLRPGKSLGRARFGPGRPLLPVARRCRGHERIDQLAGDGRNVFNGLLEDGFVGPRRLREARKLSDELDRRSLDLLVSGRRVEVEKGTDISAHTLILPTRPGLQGVVSSARQPCHKLLGITRMAAPLDELSRNADAFARLAPSEKAALIGACKDALVAAAPAWVADAARAKGLDSDTTGEEWLSGVLPAVRMAYLLERSLQAIARDGKPPLGTGTFNGPGGRLAVRLFPTSAFDRASFAGFSGDAVMQAGIDAAEARRRQASFFERRHPTGQVSLVLGAGNVSSIPPMDVFSKMFIEGKACLLKMNPVNAWLGPHLERGLEPLISRGFLRVMYGGADVGGSLVYDKRVRDVHITGSDKTHDVIVWGPPGPDRDRRMAQNTPLLDKPITSELGNVGPVAIVPHDYTDDELKFQARNIVTMVTNNAGFNCNAAHVIITSSSWPQRERFFELVARTFATIRPRKAYYPGAGDRQTLLTAGRKRVEYFGEPREGELAWALVRDVDAQDARDPAFHTEPFCGLVSETVLPGQNPVEFLNRATRFMNDTLWGTLNACLIVPPSLERDAAFKAALDRALVELRYGTVGINHWPGIGYGATSLPWGAYPGSTLTDIQSGCGWVHNTYMLEGIDKSVIRGPLRARPTPVWFSGNHSSARLGPRLVDIQAKPAWWKMPGVLFSALGG